MSVLAGIWNLDDAPVDPGPLKAIGHQLFEYGPDGESTYFSESVGILYRPYHTTPESCLERQPYLSAKQKIITWDGRLDNRDELILELSDQLGNDRTDVAIVAAALDRWSTECFPRIIGDWAVVVWNAHERELLLARDYAGIKPLFFYRSQRRVTWCNHLAPLAFCGDQFTPCDEFIAGYLAFQPDAQLTPYQEIRSVPPGQFMRIREGQSTSHSYWECNPSSRPSFKSDAEYEERFRYLFREAVRCRLRTHGPILSDLSGGLDSSSVVCMADDIVAKEGQNAALVDTFSFYDEEEPDEEDFLYLTKVEAKRGRTGRHAALRGVGDTFSLKFQESSATPGFGVRLELETAKFTAIRSADYRVLLSGNGGDQMLGQALPAGMALGDSLRQLHLLEFSEQLIAWSLFTRCPAAQLICDALLATMPVRVRLALSSRTQPLPWVDKKFAREYRLPARVTPVGFGPWRWLPSVRLRFQQLTRLQGELTHSAPRCPQETRYPFLDRRLFEFLFAVPANQLFRSGQRRSLMRRALADVLPQEILRRRTKSGTGRCDVVTLNKHWEEIETLVRAPLSAELGYIDPGEFRRALLELKRGVVNECVGQLLRALSLEVWLRDLASRSVLSIATVTPTRAKSDEKSRSVEKKDMTVIAHPNLLLAELCNPKQKGGEQYAV